MQISLEASFQKQFDSNNNKITIKSHTGGFQGQLTTFLRPSPAENSECSTYKVNLNLKSH